MEIDDLFVTTSNVRLALNYFPAEDLNFRISISGNSTIPGINHEENTFIYRWNKVTGNPKIQVNVTRFQYGLRHFKPPGQRNKRTRVNPEQVNEKQVIYDH